MEYNPVCSACRCPFHQHTHHRACDPLASEFALGVYVDNQRNRRDLDARLIVRDPRELRLDVRPRARDHLALITDCQPPDVGAIRQRSGQCRSGFVEQFPGEIIRRDFAHLAKHFNAMSSDSRSVVLSTGADLIVRHAYRCYTGAHIADHRPRLLGLGQAGNPEMPLEPVKLVQIDCANDVHDRELAWFDRDDRQPAGFLLQLADENIDG